jgi:hypothetical protein
MTICDVCGVFMENILFAWSNYRQIDAWVVAACWTARIRFISCLLVCVILHNEIIIFCFWLCESKIFPEWRIKTVCIRLNDYEASQSRDVHSRKGLYSLKFDSNFHLMIYISALNLRSHYANVVFLIMYCINLCDRGRFRIFLDKF